MPSINPAVRKTCFIRNMFPGKKKRTPERMSVYELKFYELKFCEVLDSSYHLACVAVFIVIP